MESVNHPRPVPGQARAIAEGRTPEPDVVAPGVWSVPLAMPGLSSPFSYCYVVAGADGSLHVLDPGFDTDENWSSFHVALKAFGLHGRDVSTVFATHLHPDHLGMASRFRAANGAKVAVLSREQRAIEELSRGGINMSVRLEEWQVPVEQRAALLEHAGPFESRPGLRADSLLASGDSLPIPGRSIKVIATPGHTPGHACIVARDEKLVFTGDHVLPTIYPGIGLGGGISDNAVSDYFSSLDLMEQFSDFTVAPGHEYRFHGLGARVEQIRHHQLRRSTEVATVFRSLPHASVFDVASRLTWSRGWDGLKGFMQISALHQTELHMEFVQSSRFVPLSRRSNT